MKKATISKCAPERTIRYLLTRCRDIVVAMDYAKLFENYILDETNLEADGFVLNDCGWQKTYPLENVDLEACTTLKSGFQPNIQVYDPLDMTPYTVYRSDSATGAFVGQVRQDLEELLLTIREKHFVFAPSFSTLQADEIARWALCEFNEKPDYPFSEKDTYVLRASKNQKWYALFMNIPLSKLGLDSDQNTIVLNLRIEENDRKNISTIFPAYHMNKKHWCSIPLDGRMSMDSLLELVFKSRQKALNSK